ncbi:MAG: PEP-CTERM sorting domain-containing protein, partial [Proteobacteria bacterium]|nr:PEP-CTERM sorting domain-containing protein [Pseudomonadota bacterium]
GMNNLAYILTGADNTGAWAGYYIRNNHPIGINSGYLGCPVGSVAFSGFPGGITDGTPWTGTTYYDFGANGLNLQGKDIVIGWGMTCANDVVYAAVANPVPEPATMLLLGLGLVGLAGVRRKLAVRVGRK